MDAVGSQWKIPSPGPNNLWSSSAFVTLKLLLMQRYGNGNLTIGSEVALHNALRSLELPCLRPQGARRFQPLSLQEVASALIFEFSRETVTRRHLCPLDLAEEIPSISFGSAKVGRFSSQELDYFWPLQACRIRQEPGNTCPIQ